jgi:hypothetical protein
VVWGLKRDEARVTDLVSDAVCGQVEMEEDAGAGLERRGDGSGASIAQVVMPQV